MTKRAVLIGVVALALFAPASAGAKGFHPCPDVPSKHLYDVKANFKCKKALHIAKSWEWTGTKLLVRGGFKCKKTKSYYDGSRFKCKSNRKARQVRFYVGG